MSALVDIKSEEQEALEAELQKPASHPLMRGKMVKECVPLLFDGKVTAEELGAFLVARAVRKYA